MQVCRTAKFIIQTYSNQLQRCLYFCSMYGRAKFNILHRKEVKILFKDKLKESINNMIESSAKLPSFCN